MRRANAVLNVLLGKKNPLFLLFVYEFYMLTYKSDVLGESSLSFDVGRRLFWLEHK